jgi:hypothetical protein
VAGKIRQLEPAEGVFQGFFFGLGSFGAAGYQVKEPVL